MEGIQNLPKRDLQELLCFMDRCLAAENPTNLVSTLDLLRRVVPFERATVCEVKSSSVDHAFFGSIINHSYDHAWINAYVTRGYQNVDPVVQAALTSDLPIPWRSAMRLASAGCTRRSDFLEEAAEFGLVNGLTCLTRADRRRRRTLLSLSFPVDVRPERYAGIVRTTTAHLHGALIRFVRGPDGANFVADRVELTSRESEVLKWASIGKTCWEIGKILRISERTVKFHLGNTFAKLDVVNRSQAVAKALGLGLLTF
jgi:LuxR family transcriptional regulator, quorum-sensing system regulator CviR